MRMSRAAAACRFAIGAILFVAGSHLVAFQAPGQKGRFDTLLVPDPTTAAGVATTPVDELAASDRLRAGWESFRAEHGREWRVWLDRRSGAPMLAEGPSIAWIPGSGNSLEPGPTPSLDDLERTLRAFAARNRTVLLAEDGELVLNRGASGEVAPEIWQVVFDRVFLGVPVEGDRYVFHIGHGNLVAFGAPRWGEIRADITPRLGQDQARDALFAYMGLRSDERIQDLEPRPLRLIRLAAAGTEDAAYRGPAGAGYDTALVWRFVLRIDGEPGTWVGLVDAHDGRIRGLFDDNRYAQVKGGVFPVSDDGLCPDGCEQPNWPMPFADVTVGGTPGTANTMGLFSCVPGGAQATTTLAGPYILVSDVCGPISQSVSCDADLDLQTSDGTDCVVPAGASAGNTHASRTGFYHLNRIAEKGRAWLPGNTWLQSQLTDRVNINSTCNAYWDGRVNFYRSGGGCRNTGEIAGVFLHEWGHGLDQNDGGGYDNPSEAYADITAFMQTHVSCIGRGFFLSGNCSGYGNACLNCSGIRDDDWDQRANHTPSTPAGFISTCGGGSGPCGKEVHCEGYLGGETIWDLANRDLPAAGLDAATAWQLTDKLWYKSRNGSGGNAYNCSIPSSDGCASTSWFTKLRTIDDDDGNLANGTPHAAAIFAAFDRHKIACGAASDASNRSFGNCPVLAAPALTAQAGSGSASLSWTSVPGAASYNVLRNDAGCSAGYTIVAQVAGTSYTDTGLADGFSEYYRVQAVGSNAACDGPLSNCETVTPQPFAGTISLDRTAYGCAALITVTVRDGNIGTPTTTALIRSGTEATPETIVLAQIAPGSASYTGTISTTSIAAAADGLLSVADGDAIVAEYTDADDGQGGSNLLRQASASADCRAPVISAVQTANVTGNSASIRWTTDELSDSVVHYGLVPPGSSTASSATLVASHNLKLTGLSECSHYVYSVSSADAVANRASDDNAGAYYAFDTLKNTTPDYPSAGAPIPIPDNDPTGASSTIAVPDANTVQDVDVTVNITHTYDGDLTLYLIGPNGTSVTLSNWRGGGADNFINTRFDDEAATPIASGTAPFTGSFRPDSPLSALEGIGSAGTWTLKVVDSAGIDTGTIDSWTLTLSFPPAHCGPHAKYVSHAVVADTCASGGSGNVDGTWDAGEDVQFSLTIQNDGTLPLTGVTATVTPLTAGVLMLDGTATFPSMTAGGSAVSDAPHFTVRLPASLACGSTLDFQTTITANEGNWSGSFSRIVGRLLSGNGTALDEAFAAGIPASWSVVNGGSGGGLAATWTTSNPGGRSIAAPMAAPVAIVDSDNAGTSATQDEELISPVMNFSTATAVTLDFDQYFQWYSGGQDEKGDVDVRSSSTGGAWVNVFRNRGASSPNPNHKTVDLTPQAAGASDVQIRFHYWTASYEWYWQVDNVKVTYTAPSGCAMTVCSPLPPALPKPVPDGSIGTGMTASRTDEITIQVIWDVATCSSTDHHVLYGDLATLATYAVGGSACGLGTSGSYTWSGVPSGDLWFVVVGNDGAGKEGSWGRDSSGAERNGADPSGQCGNAARDNGGTCP